MKKFQEISLSKKITEIHLMFNNQLILFLRIIIFMLLLN
jgi:hypothetical protein